MIFKTDKSVPLYLAFFFFQRRRQLFLVNSTTVSFYSSALFFHHSFATSSAAGYLYYILFRVYIWKIRTRGRFFFIELKIHRQFSSKVLHRINVIIVVGRRNIQYQICWWYVTGVKQFFPVYKQRLRGGFLSLIIELEINAAKTMWMDKYMREMRIYVKYVCRLEWNEISVYLVQLRIRSKYRD